MIVADDGSDDETAAIVAKMALSNNGSGKTVELLRTEHTEDRARQVRLRDEQNQGQDQEHDRPSHPAAPSGYFFTL